MRKTGLVLLLIGFVLQLVSTAYYAVFNVFDLYDSFDSYETFERFNNIFSVSDFISTVLLVIGVFVLLASKSGTADSMSRAAWQPQSTTPTASSDITARLRTVDDLHEAGRISQEEHAAARRSLLEQL